MDAEMKKAFADLKIDSHEELHKVQTRAKCPECLSSRKYFCYECYQLMPEIAGSVPKIKVDIIKHPLELDSKSTAVHARLLAPDHVTIYMYPDMPQYEHKDKVLLVFPYKDAISLEDVAEQMLASESKRKPEAPTDSESVKCNDSEVDRPRQMDSRSPLKEHTPTGTFQPDFQTNQDGRCRETCRGTSPARNHRETSQKPQTGTFEVEADSAVSSDGECHHQTNEHLGPDAQETDSTLSELSMESHCCHQNALNTSAYCTSDVLSFDSGDRGGQEGGTMKVEGGVCDGPFDRVIFIDSTWYQCKAMSRDQRLTGIQRVIIQDRETTFWRTQRCKPPTYLATIEAIYYFLMDYHRIILGREYGGQYDNLLFFYTFMHSLVQKTAEERQKERDAQT